MAENPSKDIKVLIKYKNLPDKPGIYIYKNKKGKIIYIGKAKSLVKRVSQYFQKRSYSASHDEILYGDKIRKLVSKIAEIDFIVTENEKEALILENDMIKKHQPRYNVLLKDDKSFPWIMITYSEKFPRILVVRQPQKLEHFDGLDVHETENKFFGPYIDVGGMKDTLKVLRKHFPYCTCKRPCKTRDRPCLYYQLGLCPGPCSGKITTEGYMRNIRSIDRIISGDIDGMIEDLNQKMELASQEFEYEQAAGYRDTIYALQNMTRKQSIVNYDDGEKINRDIIGYYKTLKKIGLLIMMVRNGRLVGKIPFIIDTDTKLGTDDEILLSILEQHYLTNQYSLPDEIILPMEFFSSRAGIKVERREFFKDAFKNLERVLTELFDKAIKVRPKGTGPYTRSLLRIANKNVQVMIKLENEYDKMMTEAEALADLGMTKEKVASMKKRDRESLVGLVEIKDILKLKELPRLIEGFDVSNWQQGDATAALVSFIDGKPSKKNYRSFIIRNKQAEGDFAMMQEAVYRRYKRLKREKGILPDLVVVDGGKVQIKAAKEVMDELGLAIPIVGLVKKSTHTEIEKIVFQKPPGSSNLEEKKLPEYTPGYNVLQFISEEFHRRAIQHHRKRMSKRMFQSPLDRINGIGEKTRKKLLGKFGSLEGVKGATMEEMQEILGEKRGKKIYERIKNNLDEN